MRIAAFVYDFPHEKSSQGLLWLKTGGFDDVVCFASPYKKLDVQKSKLRVTPIIDSLHPSAVAGSLNYTYIQIDHDNTAIVSLLSGFDIGVILGARRLKPHVVEALPIINMHPGVLPDNRGLDNLKWAVITAQPQAVTTHFIDNYLDRGRLINTKIVDVFEDDTFLDVFTRTQNVSFYEMVNALKAVNGLIPSSRFPQLGSGHYNKVMTEKDEITLLEVFNLYKRTYKHIVSNYYGAR